MTRYNERFTLALFIESRLNLFFHPIADDRILRAHEQPLFVSMDYLIDHPIA
jgi:hypothetical protein